MASLNDFIDPDLTTNDILHSNGAAQTAGGAGAGGLSMEQRRKLSYGRQMVGSYAHSQLGRRYGAAKARTADQARGRVYDASTDAFDDKAGYGNRRAGSVSETKLDKTVAKRERFTEPPSRRHDPYA